MAKIRKKSAQITRANTVKQILFDNSMIIQLRNHRKSLWRGTACLMWDSICKFVYRISIGACSVILQISQRKSNSSHTNRIILVHQIRRLCDAVNLPDVTASQGKYHDSSTRWRTTTFPHRAVPAAKHCLLANGMGARKPFVIYRPSPDVTPLNSRRVWCAYLREQAAHNREDKCTELLRC